MFSLAELAGVTPERSDTWSARRRPIPDWLSRAPEVLSLAELSGTTPERSDTWAARRRPIPDWLSRAPEVLSLAEMNARIRSGGRPAPNSPPQRIPQHYSYETSEYEKQLIKEHTDEIEDRMWARDDEWRRLGYENAADNLERFLKGGGGTKTITREEARRFPVIREAEAKARHRFENSSFLGRSENTKLNDALKRLIAGETDTEKGIIEHWDRVFGELDVQREYWFGDRDFALANGEMSIKSGFDGNAVRDGDKIRVTGTVTHSWDDPYDFSRWQPGGIDALAMQKGRRASEFKIHGEWKQRAKGTVTIRDGKLVDPRFEWVDADE